MSDTDWSDPCAALAALEPAYYALISGQQVAELRHNGKIIVNHKTNPDVLGREIARLRRACDAANGLQRGRQFAIRAG